MLIGRGLAIEAPACYNKRVNQREDFMSYQNQEQNDAHGAARSGAQREAALREFINSCGFTFIKNQLDAAKYLGLTLTKAGRVRAADKQTINDWMQGRCVFAATGDYKECGFEFFLSDGYIPELDIIVELKGGDKQGTTEEKLFFDLMKLEDGCYGNRTLVYFFEGKKETDKCTKLFTKRLLRLKEEGRANDNIHIIPLSECDADLLNSLA